LHLERVERPLLPESLQKFSQMMILILVSRKKPDTKVKARMRNLLRGLLRRMLLLQLESQVKLHQNRLPQHHLRLNQLLTSKHKLNLLLLLKTQLKEENPLQAIRKNKYCMR
jgi:hypothetical protein